MKSPQNTLKIYPALNGDCFLLTIDSIRILIDGGYVNTYHDYLKGDLRAIKKKGGAISHLIVTHIDQDHISGIVKLMEENHNDSIIKIENIWHNSYRHIQGKSSFDKPANSKIDPKIELLKSGSHIRKEQNGESEISAEQGSTLAGILLSQEYSWNEEFNGKAVSIDNNKEVYITDDISIKLLSPDKRKLDKLSKFWKKELRKNGYLEELDDEAYYDDAFEFMIAKDKEYPRGKKKEVSSGKIKIKEILETPFIEDRRAPNGSSIAFILEYGKKKLLFLGDSHPSLIVQQLKELYTDFPIRFELIKCSHHGSWGNNSPELFDLIDSTKYVFSTNGNRNGHPDYETISHVISRPTANTRTLIFNYPTPTSTAFDVAALKKKYNYDIDVNRTGNQITVEL